MKSFAMVLAACVIGAAVSAQTPPPAQQGTGRAAGAAPAAQPPQGGGRGRGGVQVMTLSTIAWSDGSLVPLRFTQAGEEVSPPLTWTAPPDGVKSFVLHVHDVDATNGDGTIDTLHWLVWNIPAASRGLPVHVPPGFELPDGSRQLSVTGPYYRGPAAPASGPVHHYLFDLYALDAMVDVTATGQNPAPTRAAVLAAMAGHVRGKATLVGRFRYAPAFVKKIAR
jgi:Raf kinase inhibitor-like YbhB/YbcL family protein